MKYRHWWHIFCSNHYKLSRTYLHTIRLLIKPKPSQEKGKESLTSWISCLDFGEELGKEVIVAGTKSLVVPVCRSKQAFFTVEHDFNFARGPLSSG